MAIEKQRAFICVYLLFYKADQILMMRRTNTPYLNGYYSIPSGHVDSTRDGNKLNHESAIDAAIREAQEETGVTLRPDQFTLILTQIKQSVDSPEPRVCLYFKISTWENEPINTEPDKADQFDFYPVNDLPKPLAHELVSGFQAIAENRPFDLFNWS